MTKTKLPNVSHFASLCPSNMIEPLISSLSPVPRAFVVVEAEHRDNPQVLKEIREYVDSRVTHYSRLVGGVFALDEIPKRYVAVYRLT